MVDAPTFARPVDPPRAKTARGPAELPGRARVFGNQPGGTRAAEEEDAGGGHEGDDGGRHVPSAIPDGTGTDPPTAFARTRTRTYSCGHEGWADGSGGGGDACGSEGVIGGPGFVGRSVDFLRWLASLMARSPAC